MEMLITTRTILGVLASEGCEPSRRAGTFSHVVETSQVLLTVPGSYFGEEYVYAPASG